MAVLTLIVYKEKNLCGFYSFHSAGAEMQMRLQSYALKSENAESFREALLFAFKAHYDAQDIILQNGAIQKLSFNIGTNFFQVSFQ